MIVNEYNDSLEHNEVGEMDFYDAAVPNLFIRRFTDRLFTGDHLIIPYCVTDYNQRDYSTRGNNEPSLGMTFTAVFEIDIDKVAIEQVKAYKRTTYAGEQVIDLGPVEDLVGADKYGVHSINIHCVQQDGVSSCVQSVVFYYQDRAEEQRVLDLSEGTTFDSCVLPVGLPSNVEDTLANRLAYLNNVTIDNVISKASGDIASDGVAKGYYRRYGDGDNVIYEYLKAGYNVSVVRNDGVGGDGSVKHIKITVAPGSRKYYLEYGKKGFDNKKWSLTTPKIGSSGTGKFTVRLKARSSDNNVIRVKYIKDQQVLASHEIAIDSSLAQDGSVKEYVKVFSGESNADIAMGGRLVFEAVSGKVWFFHGLSVTADASSNVNNLAAGDCESGSTLSANLANWTGDNIGEATADAADDGRKYVQVGAGGITTPTFTPPSDGKLYVTFRVKTNNSTAENIKVSCGTGNNEVSVTTAHTTPKKGSTYLAKDYTVCLKGVTGNTVTIATPSGNPIMLYNVRVEGALLLETCAGMFGTDKTASSGSNPNNPLKDDNITLNKIVCDTGSADDEKWESANVMRLMGRNYVFKKEQHCLSMGQLTFREEDISGDYYLTTKATVGGNDVDLADYLTAAAATVAVTKNSDGKTTSIDTVTDPLPNAVVETAARNKVAMTRLLEAASAYKNDGHKAYRFVLPEMNIVIDYSTAFSSASTSLAVDTRLLSHKASESSAYPDIFTPDIIWPNRFVVDLGGSTISALQTVQVKGYENEALASAKVPMLVVREKADGYMVHLNHNEDTHVVNGAVVGCYDHYDFTTARNCCMATSEDMKVVHMKGSVCCTFENLDISNAVGYDVGFSDGRGVLLGEDNNENQAILTASNKLSPFDMKGFLGYDKEAHASKYCAGAQAPVRLEASDVYFGPIYTGTAREIVSRGDAVWGKTFYLKKRDAACGYMDRYIGDNRSMIVAFYKIDDDGVTWLKTMKVSIYTNVFYPKDANAVRLCAIGNSVDGFRSSVNVQYTRDSQINTESAYAVLHRVAPMSCRLVGCSIHDTRSTLFGKNGMQLSLESCRFWNVAAENGDDRMSKLLVDIEDGPGSMQNIFIHDCELLYGDTRVFRINYSVNICVTECRNLNFDAGTDIYGMLVDGCIGYLSKNGGIRSPKPYERIMNCTFQKVELMKSKGRDLGTADGKIQLYRCDIRHVKDSGAAGITRKLLLQRECVDADGA